MFLQLFRYAVPTMLFMGNADIPKAFVYQSPLIEELIGAIPFKCSIPTA